MRLVLDVQEGVEVSEVVDNLNYDFTADTAGAAVMDSAITDSTVIDSK